MDIPDEFDWQLWRIVASDRLQSSLVEIERDWTLADVENAHLTLDIIEDANTR